MTKKQVLIFTICLLTAFYSSPVWASSADWLSADYSEHGLRGIYNQVDGKNYYGVIDEEGNVLIPADKASEYITHRNGFILLNTNEAGYECKAVSKDGSTIKLFKHRLIWYDGRNGVAVNGTDAETLFALTDDSGTLITPFEFEYLYYLGVNSEESKGTVFHAEKNGLWGMIDREGRLVLPFEYQSFSHFATGYPYVFINKTRFIMGVASIDGKVIIPSEYGHVGFSDGFFGVTAHSKFAVFNDMGENLTGFIFDHGTTFSEGYCPVMINGKWGCLDADMNMAIPAKYDSIDEFVNGYANVKENGEVITIKNPLMDSRKINIFVDGKWMFTEQEPFIESGRVMVPLRKPAEALDYYVQWNSDDKSILFQNLEKTISITIGKKIATVNILDDGIPVIDVALDAAPVINGGRTYVPLRFLAENMGAVVEWENETSTVRISKRESRSNVAT